MWFSTTSSLVALSNFCLFIILLCLLFCHFFSQTHLLVSPAFNIFITIQLKYPIFLFLDLQKQRKNDLKKRCCNLQGPKSEAPSENQTHSNHGQPDYIVNYCPTPIHPLFTKFDIKPQVGCTQ